MTFPSSRPPVVALALGAVGLAALITVVGLFVLGLGPFAAPSTQPSNSSTARPTTQATIGAPITPSPSATQQSSTAPAPSPTGSPDVSQPPATPSTASDALLAHVPEALHGTCAAASFEEPALAVVSCTADGGAITVTYTLYADQPSMAAVYDAAVIAAGIDDSSGRCYNRNAAGEIVATTTRWPAENGYSIQDEPAGRYLCFDDGTTATLNWTDDRLYILAIATADKAIVDRLLSFWIDEAGPVE